MQEFAINPKIGLRSKPHDQDESEKRAISSQPAALCPCRLLMRPMFKNNPAVMLNRKNIHAK